MNQLTAIKNDPVFHASLAMASEKKTLRINYLNYSYYIYDTNFFITCHYISQ